MSKTIGQLTPGGAVNTSALIEAELPGGGPGSSISYPLADILAFATSDLDAVLVAGNDAAGIGITELSNIDNIVNDFDLLIDNGNVIFNFGNAPSGIFGLDAAADQMLFTSNQWLAASSDSNMLLSIDVDTQLIEFTNQSNYLRITDFDIEVGMPILGYSTTSEMTTYVNTQVDSLRFKIVKGRTTAALPSCTANAGFTTLTSVANQSFPSLTTETDGLTYGLLQDILVMDEADHKRWGIYSLTTPGSGSTKWVLTRRSDSNPGTDLTAGIYNIQEGTRFKNTSWRQTTLNPVFGTDNLNFIPFGDNIVADSISGYYKIISTSGVLSTTSI